MYCTNNKGTILLALPPDRIPSHGLERIQEAGGGRTIVVSKDNGEIEKNLDSFEIIIGEAPFSLISRMQNLQWVQLWMAGADQLQLYPEVKDHPFRLTSTSGMHGRQLAEHIFALLLAWCRNLKKALSQQEKHEWLQIRAPELPVLEGKTMLILGYGTIGEETGRTAMAFGMKVIGIRRRIPAGPSIGQAVQDTVRVEPSSKILQLLPEADVVLNILPFTQETKYCIGTKEFAAMKQSAVYINVGRGATTDETAMIRALKTGKIAGALLDVAEHEPLPLDSPLWDMKNVIITGHYAGLREDYDDLALEIALDNLGRYVRGEPLKSLVDKNAGY
ncbi:MAG: D-2-hydroxyacid dehydrogenase [Treponema sp.]|jgi:phosphoglycerate dehydrogenase-like enzyme|nr:D-2-hydroxyacid dehydrogenase [Treponema sp.]